MAEGISSEILGIPELRAKLDVPKLVGEPMKKFLTASALKVEQHAKDEFRGWGRDTGLLFASLQTKVDSATFPRWATVGTTNPYAIYVHGEPPNPPERSRPHWPPIDAITPWAKRHGIPPFLVARAIARRGTKLVPFLSRGLTKAQSFIDDQLAKMGAAIRDNWLR